MRTTMILAVVFLGITCTLATAQQPQPLVDMPTETLSVEARMAQLESELDGLRHEVCTSLACQKPKCDGSCQDRSGFESGFSLFFAKPSMKESFEATVADVATGTFSLIPFDFDHEISPRVWFGYFGKSGLGVRARYWQYDHNAKPLSTAATNTTFPAVSSITVIFPAALSTLAPGDLLSVESGLQVHTIDIEGAQKAELLGMDVIASAGIRYASLEQNFDSSVTRGAASLGTLNWKRKFEGTGLTTGIEANKSLAGSGLSVFGSGRGSILFGEKTLQRTTVGDITPTDSAVLPNVILDDADELAGIFEMTGGVEWSRSTSMGNVFVRGSYETQLWTAAGAPTLTFLGFDGIALSVGLVR